MVALELNIRTFKKKSHYREKKYVNQVHFAFKSMSKFRKNCASSKSLCLNQMGLKLVKSLHTNTNGSQTSTGVPRTQDVKMLVCLLCVSNNFVQLINFTSQGSH